MEAGKRGGRGCVLFGLRFAPHQLLIRCRSLTFRQEEDVSLARGWMGGWMGQWWMGGRVGGREVRRGSVDRSLALLSSPPIAVLTSF